MPVRHELAHDQFARETAKHAHARIKELTAQIARLEKEIARKRLRPDACYLCGDPPARGSIYCHGCSWAEGTAD